MTPAKIQEYKQWDHCYFPVIIWMLIQLAAPYIYGHQCDTSVGGINSHQDARDGTHCEPVTCLNSWHLINHKISVPGVCICAFSDEQPSRFGHGWMNIVCINLHINIVLLRADEGWEAKILVICGLCSKASHPYWEKCKIFTLIHICQLRTHMVFRNSSECLVWYSGLSTPKFLENLHFLENVLSR